MATKDEKTKELWASWTNDALAHYEEPKDIKDIDDLVDDMVDFTSAYADAMLEEFEHRFVENASARKRRGKGKSRSRRADPDDEDEDDEDDDD